MKRLVWLIVNSSYSHSSLALPLIHSVSREIPGWKWERLEVTLEEDPAETAIRIASLKGNLLCATLYLFNRNAVLDILSRVKALLPEIHIAVGGPEALGSGAENLLASSPFIGTVFRGEGEIEFPQFLRSFPTENRGILPENGKPGVYHDWAEKSGIPAEDAFFRTDKPFVQLETSRGCPMKCIYCTSANSPVRFKSIEAVRRELTVLREKKVHEIRLLDRTFNYPPSRGAELLRLFREEFPELRFHLEIHPQCLNDDLRAELSQANPGQLHLEAGIQSLDPNVMRAIGRGGDPETVLEGIRFLCSCTAFETHVDLIAGLPEQNIESIFRDVSTLIASGPAEIQLEVLKVLPGTALRESPLSTGCVYSPDPPYDVMRTPLMSGEAILVARLLSRLLDLTYNHPALHPVIRHAQTEKPDMLKSLFSFFIERGLSLRKLYDLRDRFLLLAEFLANRNFEQSGKVLALQWLRFGYQPGVGPGKSAEAVEIVPDHAKLLSGDPDAASLRGTKFWKLCDESGNLHIFAFNRSIAMNKPAAEWIQIFD